MAMSELERKREQRKTGIAAAERVAKVAGEAEGVIMTAAQKRKSALKGRSAEGLAAAVSGAPQTGLGARAAAAQEIAKKQGLAEGDVVAGSMEKAQAAKEGAAEADLALTEFKRKQGSEVLDVRKRNAEIDAKVTGLIETYENWHGDDEDAFARELLAFIKDDPPEIRDAIIRRYREHSDWGDTAVWDSPEAQTSDKKEWKNKQSYGFLNLSGGEGD